MRELAERQVPHRAGGERQQAGAERVAEASDGREEPVVLQSLDQPVGRGSREPGRRHDVRERPGAVLDRSEDGGAPVEHPDAAGRRVHAEVLATAGEPGAHELAVAHVELEPDPLPLEVVVSSCYHRVPLYGTEFHYVEQP